MVLVPSWHARCVVRVGVDVVFGICGNEVILLWVVVVCEKVVVGDKVGVDVASGVGSLSVRDVIVRLVEDVGASNDS